MGVLFSSMRVEKERSDNENRSLHFSGKGSINVDIITRGNRLLLRQPVQIWEVLATKLYPPKFIC